MSKHWLRKHLEREPKVKKRRGRPVILSPKEKHIKSVLYSAKQGALKRGLEFSITREDLSIPENCPYFGWELTYRRGEGRLNTNFSINRIDASKGYIVGNVEVCCDLANRMIQDCSQERLLQFARGVINQLQR